MTDRTRALEDHLLHVEAETDRIQAYRLARPGTRNLSVQLTFTPEGIHIMGDLRIGPNGDGLTYRDPGRGLRWFLGATSPSYLAEKFLHKVWRADRAIEDLREEIEDADLEHSAAMVQHLKAVVFSLERDDEAHLRGFVDDLTCNFVDHHEDGLAVWGSYHLDDDPPGMCYDPSDLAWLVAIQARFRTCWLARRLSR